MYLIASYMIYRIIYSRIRQASELSWLGLDNKIKVGDFPLKSKADQAKHTCKGLIYPLD